MSALFTSKGIRCPDATIFWGGIRAQKKAALYEHAVYVKRHKGPNTTILRNSIRAQKKAAVYECPLYLKEYKVP